jgi:4-hydroxybenzoate polyprenyltransferase
MLAIIAIDAAYSVRPLVWSRRTYAAPLVLPLVYAALPFVMGVSAAGRLPDAADGVMVAGFYLLFLSRIILKDFRDRAGDRAFGKVTFLLKHGKRAVVVMSRAALLAGGVMVVCSLAEPPAIAFILALYLLVALWALQRLGRAGDLINELVSIALFAKAGNAFLLTVLACLVLRSNGTPVPTQVALLAVITLLLGANLVMFVRFPKLPRLAAPEPPKLLR